MYKLSQYKVLKTSSLFRLLKTTFDAQNTKKISNGSNFFVFWKCLENALRTFFSCLSTHFSKSNNRRGRKLLLDTGFMC